MPMKLLKFTATWCGPCSTLNATLEKMALPEGIEMESIDLDNASPAMISMFGVRSVPTLILVDENNKEIKRRLGSGTQQQLMEWLS